MAQHNNAVRAVGAGVFVELFLDLKVGHPGLHAVHDANSVKVLDLDPGVELLVQKTC